MAASCWGLGWVIHQCTVGDTNPFVFVRAARSRNIHGRKSRRRTSREPSACNAAHNPLSWRVLSVAGRWLGCVLEQSTARLLAVVRGSRRDGDATWRFASDDLSFASGHLFPAHLSGATFCVRLRPMVINICNGLKVAHSHVSLSLHPFCHLLRSYCSSAY